MDIGSVGKLESGGAAPSVSVRTAQKPQSAGKSKEESSSRANKLANVRERMRSGYYQSGEVNEAISDKISGVFDQLA